MNQGEKAARFAGLHVKGKPLVLFNAWDAGSAKTIVAAGAKAIATSSWSVAAAQGFKDGEDLPLALVHQVAARITATVDVPVSVDFEGGYSDDDAVLASNIAQLLDIGIVGINFEDRVVKGSGLYAIDRQARRIAVIRKAAEQKGVPLFINARTDVFFEQGDGSAAATREAIERGKAYAAAGASGLFIPGLTTDTLIAQVCESSTLPVNAMMWEGLPSHARLAELGIARISYGAQSYAQAMETLAQEARKAGV
jgi:2-methylisocitrate lyase-like PEP mutase family enzyme